MKPSGVVVCPSCGTKNRPKWEFCVSCGESLKNVPAEAEAKTVAVAAAPAGQPSGAGVSLLTTIAGVGLLVAAFLWLRGNRAEPLKPEPSIFTVPAGERPRQTPPATTAAGPVSPGLSLLSRGEALLVAGNAAGALPLLAEAVGLLPDNSKAHYLHAGALWHTGSRDEAVGEYRRAIELDPSARLYRSDLAKALGSLGRREEAAAEYEALLGVDPRSPGALRDLAAIYAQLGNRERWLELLNQAVEIDPGSAVLRQDLAYALEKSGRTSEAIDAYRRVVELEPKAATSRGLLADLLFRQGRADEAIAVVQDGIQLDPGSARPHRDLASLYERTGRISEAIAEYREYARLAPTSPDARQLAERAERLARSPGGGS
jgi:tetratricopeptide (TPR) repeat protein